MQHMYIGGTHQAPTVAICIISAKYDNNILIFLYKYQCQKILFKSFSISRYQYLYQYWYWYWYWHWYWHQFQFQFQFQLRSNINIYWKGPLMKDGIMLRVQLQKSNVVENQLKILKTAVIVHTLTDSTSSFVSTC